jgi:hypothetical protein
MHTPQPWGLVRWASHLQPTTCSLETWRQRTHGEGKVESALATTTLDDSRSSCPSVGHPTFTEGQSSCRGIAGSSRVIDLAHLDDRTRPSTIVRNYSITSATRIELENGGSSDRQQAGPCVEDELLQYSAVVVCAVPSQPQIRAWNNPRG